MWKWAPPSRGCRSKSPGCTRNYYLGEAHGDHMVRWIDVLVDTETMEVCLPSKRVSSSCSAEKCRAPESGMRPYAPRHSHGEDATDTLTVSGLGLGQVIRRSLQSRACRDYDALLSYLPALPRHDAGPSPCLRAVARPRGAGTPLRPRGHRSTARSARGSDLVRQRDLAACEGRLDRGLQVRGRIDLGELRALQQGVEERRDLRPPK